MNERPICQKCDRPCIVRRTRTASDGSRIQHRYCPVCGVPRKTSYIARASATGLNARDERHATEERQRSK